MEVQFPLCHLRPKVDDRIQLVPRAFTFHIRDLVFHHSHSLFNLDLDITQKSSFPHKQSTHSSLLQKSKHPIQSNIRTSKHGRPYASHISATVLQSSPHILTRFSNSSMGEKTKLESIRATKLRPNPLAMPDAADAIKKAKIERFLQGMAVFQEEQGNAAPIAAVVISDSLFFIFRCQSPCVYCSSLPQSFNQSTTYGHIYNPFGSSLHLKFPKDR